MSESDERISCNLTENQAEKLKQNLPGDEEIHDLAEFFRVFGDPSRIRILFLLKEGEFCVHDIAALAEMNQTAVSHHRKSLRQARLVKYRKEGKMVFYSLNDEHIDDIIAIGLRHLEE